MKKILMHFVLGILATSSFAQVQIGIRGGLNVSNIVGKYYSNYDFLLGPHAGAFLRFNPDQKAFFQPEVIFSMKGNTFRDQGSAGKYVNTLRVNYLDIPLMVGLAPVDGFNILLGVQPSVLLGARNITRYAGKRSSSSANNLNSFDFGLVGGIQFLRDSGVDFGIRVSYGLINVSGSSSAFHNRNLNFMATLGYAFGK